MSEQTSWTSPPEDFPAAVRAVKKLLREQIGDVEAYFKRIEAHIEPKVREIEEARDRGERVWPVVRYADIEAGTVPQDTIDLIHRRGCAIVRGQVDPELATQWDQALVDYVDGNDFMSQYRGPGDDFFGSVGSKPEIYPIYWSGPQMEARQHPRMATVQSFLNSFWTSESEGRQWFDPDRDALYPDRVRRRPPGTTSAGLSPHVDAGNLDLWL
ncbi:MAG: YbiU family protein, partial [Arachnia sp.]